MDYLAAYVSLAGDSRSVVFKTGLSIPEVQILQLIHGRNSVNKVQRTHADDKEDVQDEMNRLRSKYGEIVDQAFPGLNPNVDLWWPEEPEEVKPKRKRATRKKKAEPVAEENADDGVDTDDQSEEATPEVAEDEVL